MGIIANPAAGKDVRRLVAHASVFDNNEKVNIVRRVLLGLDAVGISKAVIMPDAFGIGAKALSGARLALDAELLQMECTFKAPDSMRAAKRMRAAGVACIVTLGGDGTNRVVAKECGDVPLLPISTGTNNAFPQMIEGTLVGMAAGLVARGIVDAGSVASTAPRLEVWREQALVDIALVDAVVVDEWFIGSKAIWDVSKVRQIVLARVRPESIGFSAVGANLPDLAPAGTAGLAIEVGEGSLEVLAPIAPGLIERVPVAQYRVLRPGEEVAIRHTPAVLALDGERQIELHAGESYSVRLNANGPRVIDVAAVLQQAAQAGFFTAPPLS